MKKAENVLGITLKRKYFLKLFLRDGRRGWMRRVERRKMRYNLFFGFYSPLVMMFVWKIVPHRERKQP
jgi:hypothetical protein